MNSKFWLYVQAITFLTVTIGLFLVALNWVDRKMDERYSINSVVVYDPCEDYEPTDEEVEDWIRTQELFKARAIQIEMKKNRKKLA
jgi:hypothetical protein